MILRRGDFHLLAADLAPLPEWHPALRKDARFEEVLAFADAHHHGAAGMSLHQQRNGFAEIQGIFFVVHEADQRHGAGAQHAAGFLLRLLPSAGFAVFTQSSASS